MSGFGTAPSGDRPENLGVYNAPDVVASYAGLDRITPCERFLFDTHLAPGAAILDLGVGGGRTTRYLSNLASDYVGVDYAEEMVEACHERFPQLRFVLADASDLSCFAAGSFDAVIFSFNGIDYLAPDEKRRQCFRECFRVLRREGVLIFSSHNPRALFINRGWDRERLRTLAHKFVGSNKILFYPTLASLIVARVGFAFLRMVAEAISRAARRLATKTFWNGEGYLSDSTHGGLRTHSAVPCRVIAELTALDFEFLRVLPEHYPRKTGLYATRWFYYTFKKSKSR